MVRIVIMMMSVANYIVAEVRIAFTDTRTLQTLHDCLIDEDVETLRSTTKIYQQISSERMTTLSYYLISSDHT